MAVGTFVKGGGTVLMEYWTCCDATVREYGTTSSGKFDIHTPVRGCKVCKRLRKRTDDAEVAQPKRRSVPTM